MLAMAIFSSKMWQEIVMTVTRHLTNADLEDLLFPLETAPERVETTLVHLVACSQCREQFLATHGARAEQCLADIFGYQAVEFWHSGDAESGQPVAIVECTYSLLGEVGKNSLAHASLLATNRNAARSLLGSVALMEEARRLWNVNPSRAESLIDASEQNLRTLLSEEPLAAAAQLCRCLAFRANSLRIRGALQEAESVIDEALAWYESTLQIPKLEKELLLYRGLIQREQRNVAAAIDNLTKALEPPGLSGGYTTCIEAKITLSIAYKEAGEPEKALSTLEAVLHSHAQSELGDFLYFAALQNLAILHAELGQPKEARGMLPALEGTLKRLPQGDLLRFRLTWLEAKICETEGNRSGAASFFRETIQACRTFDLPYDAALAALELAHLLLEAEDTGAAKSLAEELIPIFEAGEIHREARTAGLVLAQVLRREAATTKHVCEVMDVVFHGKGRSRGQIDDPQGIESEPHKSSV